VTRGDTIDRQWRIVRAIPVAPRRMTTTELHRILIDAGHVGLTPRTVQRDVEALQELFPIRADRRSKPYGWYWSGGGHPDSQPRLSDAQAVAFFMLEQQAGQLPPAVERHLRPYFVEARGILAQDPARPFARWPQLVRTLASRRPGRPPSVPESVMQAVCEALFQRRELKIRYRGATRSEAMEQTLHPLGLVSVQGLYYLVALAWDYEDIRHYALHRMTTASVETGLARTLPGFDLDSHIRSGAFTIPFSDRAITLVFLMAREMAVYVREAPLALNQRESAEGDRVRFEVKVPDGIGLRTWMLSQGEAIEILKPKALRQWIARTLAQAQTHYDQPAPKGPSR